MSAANQSLFDDPAEYQRQLFAARGGGQGGVRGGMGFVTEDKLRPGDIIWRIGHSSLPIERNISSAWWLRDASFKEIVGASERSGTDLGTLFRMKCAVSYDFGTADLILEVQVRSTLRVFSGRGRPVMDNDPGKQGQCWLGGFEIAQLYIPGLRDKSGAPTRLCQSALKLIDTYRVTEFIEA